MSDRPGWMEGGTKKPPRAASDAIKNRPLPPAVQQEDAPTTHRNVVVGVTILAVTSLFSTWFAVTFGVVSAINPPQLTVREIIDGEFITIDDYFTFGRIAICFAVSVLLTFVSWHIVDSAVD